MSQTIIWLSGYGGSGKDTAANYLEKEFGFYRVAFADILKMITSIKYHFPLELTKTQEGKNTIINGQTVRYWLIYEAKKTRDVDTNYYSRIICQLILQHPDEHIVISDWRYVEEFDFIHKILPTKNHVTIRIHRPCIMPSNVPSEHQLDHCSFHYNITNTTIETLYRTLCEILVKCSVLTI